ncbi:MAG: glycerate kinase type-2 family protein, partial [Candidatus Hermodarchaeia archaeon]
SDLIKGSLVNQQARRFALELLEAALVAVNPSQMVYNALQIKGSQLNLFNQRINLNKTNGVYLVGAGKATGHMAEAAEEILGDHITDGIIIVPPNTTEEYTLNHVQIREGGHPLPTHSSVSATKQIMTLIENSPEDALILSLFSGGGSALFTLPTTQITLKNLQDTTTLLLQSGVPIDGINTLRKHLSQVKGGQFALQVHPRNHWVMLISDVPGDQLDMIASGPTLPDPTTFLTVGKILDEYQLWEKLPQRIREHVQAGLDQTVQETPKPDHPVFEHTVNRLIGSNIDACKAAFNAAQQKGLKARILTTECQGEARQVGEKLGALAQRMTSEEDPQVVIVGSETTVTLRHPGKGGRNTELIAATLPFLQNHEGLVIASLATDGIDGPTQYAGAIADNHSYTRAQSLNVHPEVMLARNDTYTLFEALNDHIFTGSTHTNVRDITIILQIRSAQ